MSVRRDVEEGPPELASSARIRVGVSACLVGERVRYDGGHKLDETVTGILGRRFELVAVCPEAESGMGVPREPVRLVVTAGDLRMRGVSTDHDHTEAMRRFARRRIADLGRLGIRGYILKSRSPSCAAADAPAVTTEGATAGMHSGLFAAELAAAMPLLPIVAEAALADDAVRDDFVERVVAYDRRCRQTGDDRPRAPSARGSR